MDKNVQDFLTELGALTEKYKLEIASSGCCNSPFLYDLSNDDFEMPAVDLSYDRETKIYNAKSPEEAGVVSDEEWDAYVEEAEKDIQPQVVAALAVNTDITTKLKYKQWSKNTFENPTCQNHLEEKLDSLIPVFFNEKEDYAIEKFIKSFCEGLCYLEKLLLYKKGIHPTQFSKITFIADSKELADKFQEVENILLAEINRQYRNYAIFLTQVNYKKI